MDSRVTESNENRPLRRSTRQSSGNVKSLTFEATPRGPLKRTRKVLKDQAPAAAAVNGSKHVEADSEDEESPSKKSRPETGGAAEGSGDENEMDVQESDEQLENNEDNDIIQESHRGPHQPLPSLLKMYQGAYGDINLSPRVVLGERHKPHNAVNQDADWIKTKKVKPPTKATTKSAAPTDTMCRPLKVSSMADYKKTMEAKAMSTGMQTGNCHIPSVYPASEVSYTTRQRMNNIPPQKQPAQQKKQEIKKPAVTKKSSGYSCRGFMWCLWRLVLLLLLCLALVLACKVILKKSAGGRLNPSRIVKHQVFSDQLSILETQFPSQCADLWKRSRIHLGGHLKTARPTEPVSLIFTAGHRAERTLHCLAQRLASSFSSAINASVLHIDGASKASQASDQVKLDIDSQLQAAFEGDKPVAVIHRFEALPPASTLIFYRYCDHETAAYKQVFLLFTVLLPQAEVSGEQSLKEVEEMVHDYLKERLVDSSNQTGFNQMDIDKFSGLWSRISHLVLPVVSETDVERDGC